MSPTDRVARTEPTLDQRIAAQQSFQMFAAFRQAGFTEMQSLHLIGTMLAAAQLSPPGEDGS